MAALLCPQWPRPNIMMTEKFYKLQLAFDEVVETAQASDLPDLAGLAARFQAQVFQRMATPPRRETENGKASPEPGRYLSAEQAAQMFGVTPRWLYRNKQKLSASQPSRKVVRFHEGKLRKYFDSAH